MHGKHERVQDCGGVLGDIHDSSLQEVMEAGFTKGEYFCNLELCTYPTAYIGGNILIQNPTKKLIFYANKQELIIIYHKNEISVKFCSYK